MDCVKAFFVIFTLAVVGAGGYYAYEKMNASPQEPPYMTAVIERGPIAATVMATGTVEPLVKVLVGSQVSGTVQRLYADFNDEVKEGVLLAELDQDRFQAVVTQRAAAVAVAKARVEEAQARVAEAEIQQRQIEDAYARSASSSFELQTAKIAYQAAVAALHGAEAQARAAEAELASAEIELGRTRIYSPIDGVVISRDIDAGQTVAASLQAPTLFTIANDLKKMRVNAAVSEQDIGQVREGMSAEFRVDAYPARRFRGKVTQVRYAETVVENVVTYQTLIEVENPELLLRPGMTASILFEVDRAEDVLKAPNAALRFDPKQQPEELNWMPGKGKAMQPRIFRLVGGLPEEVKVDVGINDGSYTEIRSEQLNAGDSVIIDWNLRAARGRARQFRPPFR